MQKKYDQSGYAALKYQKEYHVHHSYTILQQNSLYKKYLYFLSHDFSALLYSLPWEFIFSSTTEENFELKQTNTANKHQNLSLQTL